MDYRIVNTINNMSAGTNTLLSISDGLGPSIFCPKMEKRILWEEKWMEKLFIYPQSRHFDFDVAICKVIFRNCTLTWCVNIYVSARKKDK